MSPFNQLVCGNVRKTKEVRQFRQLRPQTSHHMDENQPERLILHKTPTATISAIIVSLSCGCQQSAETNVSIPDIISAGQNFTGKNAIKYPTLNSQDCEDPDGCIETTDMCTFVTFADSFAITQGNGQINHKHYDSECIGVESHEPYTTADATVNVLGVLAGSSLNREEKVFF